jgi:A/G-specific adenine glycosylase
VAHAQGESERYPVKTRKLKRTAEQLWLLQAQTSAGEVWLVQRPSTGVWAGLYCLPVFESSEALQQSLPASRQAGLQPQAVVKHVLTHKDLYLHPVRLVLPRRVSLGEGQWVASVDWPALGLPAPIRQLLQAG